MKLTRQHLTQMVKKVLKEFTSSGATGGETSEYLQQLQQALEGAQQEIKKVSGDLQTAHREAVSARKRTEVEKFKAELSKESSQSKADTKLSIDRLKDAVKLESEKLRLGSQAQLRREKSQKEK